MVEQSKIWTAALVVIGDEILSGRTQDKNVAQVATWLNDQGIRLAEVRIVPDVLERIGEAVNALRSAHDYVFTTGGIGPTHDDITVDAIAAALGVPVVIHPQARQLLEDYYRDRPGGITDARLRMARVPEGAELIPNPTSGAPGVKIGNVYIMAGVPYIAASMLEALTGETGRGAACRLRDDRSAGAGERRRRPPAGDGGGAPGSGHRQLSLFQGRPVRGELRDPVGGWRSGAGDGAGSFSAPARGGLRAGRWGSAQIRTSLGRRFWSG